MFFFSDFDDIFLSPPSSSSPLPTSSTPLLQLPSPCPSRKLKNVLVGILRITGIAARQRENLSPVDERQFFGVGDSNDENIETAF